MLAEKESAALDLAYGDFLRAMQRLVDALDRSL
jgi:hypothetical protein